MPNKLYIGLMSGTSLDGIDAALLNLGDNKVELVATHAEPIPKALKQKLLALCTPGENEIHRLAEADVMLGRLFADSALKLLEKTGIQAKEIEAIGSHGQTIRHMPSNAFTLQIGDPNIIAAQTGITTVADFRRRDLALGGEGAPLAPAFHEALLQTTQEDRWVLNIGGIANLTDLPADQTQDIMGFDTGPGNTLLDAWCSQKRQCAFDNAGEWAASGTVDSALLESLLADPYFQKKPPKSTGREYFNLNWLNEKLGQLDKQPAPEAVQATLLELTAQSIAQSIKSTSASVWLCGGGVHNLALIHRLKTLCPSARFTDTSEVGIHPDWLEAAAFAWLAQQTINNQPGNIPSVTGAKKASVLGAIYSADKTR